MLTPKIFEKVYYNFLFYSIIGLIILMLIAPFVEIPYRDDALEKFGKEHPYITGIGTIIFGLWLFLDNYRDGHSDKWIKRKDYFIAILIVGVGFYHLIKEMI